MREGETRRGYDKLIVPAWFVRRVCELGGEEIRAGSGKRVGCVFARSLCYESQLMPVVVADDDDGVLV